MPFDKKKYDADYVKKNMHRIPLTLQNNDYEKLKDAAEAAGESVNAYIRKAITMRIVSESTSK